VGNSPEIPPPTTMNFKEIDAPLALLDVLDDIVQVLEILMGN